MKNMLPKRIKKIAQYNFGFVVLGILIVLISAYEYHQKDFYAGSASEYKIIVSILILLAVSVLLIFCFIRRDIKDLTETSEMLEKMNDAAQDSIILMDNNGKVARWNKSSERIFGYSENEIKGKDLHMILAPKRYHDDHKKGFTLFKDTGKGDMVGRTLEFFALHKSGKEFPIEISLASVNLAGKWCGLGIVRDITERKRSAASLKTESERIEKILRTTPSAVFSVDRNRMVTSWNNRAEQITGYAAQEVLGRCCTLFSRSHCDEKCGLLSKDVIKPVFGKECTVGTKDGKTKIISKNLDEIKDDSGQLVGGIECFEDITELRQYQKGLEILVDQKTADIARREKVMQSLMEDLNISKELIQKEKEELARSNKELEEFAYVASHDLQEPLRMVASYVGLLEKKYSKELNGEAKEYIEFAVDGARRMQTLIKDLLEYSRVGRKGEPFTEIDTEGILGKVTEILKVTINNTGAQIIWNKLPSIKADAIQMTQVFQNLIANAIKFRSDEVPKICVECKEDDNFWTFAIKDNGIGFDGHFADKIFGLFVKLHGKNEYEGTGIGLAICKKLVERRGGRIWAESETEKGASFYFTIPKRPDEVNP